MRSLISEQGSSASPQARSTALSDAIERVRIRPMASKARLSCTTSRGETRPTATLEMIRSTSPTSASCPISASRSKASPASKATASCRRLISASSRSGKSSQRFSSRAPMGEVVSSIVSRRERPPSLIDRTSSRLWTVNLSSLT